MISIKKAILAGTVALGLAGFTAYASGAFCTIETAQQQTAQTMQTSNSGQSCCADEGNAQKTVAHNALFTPTTKTAALSGGGCPYEAQQTVAACGAQKTTATTVAMTGEGQSCCAKEGGKASASKTALAGDVPATKTAN